VDGRTLRDVTRSAPLDAATAIDIGIQVASALADHQRGHREPAERCRIVFAVRTESPLVASVGDTQRRP
jgi:hypothetical protein